MPWHKVRIEVVDILGTGKCSMEQKVGNTYIFPDEKGKMCVTSLHSLYPFIVGLQSGGTYSGQENTDEIMLGCPDFKHQVVYRMKRILTE